MAKIQITDFGSTNPNLFSNSNGLADDSCAGSNLLFDHESFMNDLSEVESEVASLRGGCTPFGLGVLIGYNVGLYLVNAM